MAAIHSHRIIAVLRPTQLSRWLVLVGWLAAASGATWAPWIHRAPAGLTLTAPDLAEFVKFLPEVRTGTVTVQRLLFLAPLFVVVGSIALLVSSARLRYPGWLRAVVMVAASPLALLLLPPVWSPAVLMADEFRAQTAACGLCIGLMIGSRWLHHLPWLPLALALTPLWLAAPLLALWQLRVVQPAITVAYATPVTPAWGAWAALAGSCVVCLGLWLGGTDAHHHQDR